MTGATTYSALSTVSGQRTAEQLAEAMEQLEPAPTGVGMTEVEDGSGLWEVGAYFDAPPDEVALAVLAAAHDARPFMISALPETDWVAHVKRTLSPVVAGRFFVHGSHDAASVPEGAEPLLIEASMAFGTGHHGTTLGCLQALDQLVSAQAEPRKVLDLGCGTAVLAMAAARIWPCRAIASDIDPVAVEVARTNVAANGLGERVQCVVAAGFDHPVLRAAQPFELIFANILKGPLITLAEEMTGALATGGHVILSGILNEQADEVAEHYARFGNSLYSRAEIGDWTTLIFSKTSE